MPSQTYSFDFKREAIALTNRDSILRCKILLEVTRVVSFYCYWHRRGALLLEEASKRAQFEIGNALGRFNEIRNHTILFDSHGMDIVVHYTGNNSVYQASITVPWYG